MSAGGVLSGAELQRVAANGGFWRRCALALSLRLTVKGRFKPDADIERLRAMVESLDRRLAPQQGQPRREPVVAPGFAGEWIEAGVVRAQRVILYLHGGAFILRTPRTHAHLLAQWCAPLGARGLMVDYRLAPEHPWPAGLDDCHAAYRWLLAEGVAPEHIVLAGDSAGGNLSLALLHRLKAAGEPLPACAVLLSPFVDFTLSSPSLWMNERSDAMFTFAGMGGLRGLYAQAEQYLHPELSPLCGDYAGFPPLYFQASDSEMLRDESVRAAERARQAGVDVVVELWEGFLPHVFQAFHQLPQARQANARVVDYLARRMGWSS